MEKETFLSKLKKFAVDIINENYPESIEAKFKDEKLADGTLISYEADALAEGVVVMIIDETGTKLPAPMGNYVTEEGTQFEVIDDMGTVGTVIPTEQAPEEEAPVAAPATETAQSAPQAQPKAIVESVVKETRFESEEKELEKEVLDEKFTKAIEKVEAEKAEILEKFEAVKKNVEKQDEIIKELFSLISKLNDETPAEKPTETRTNKFNVKAYKDEFKRDLQELRNKNIN